MEKARLYDEDQGPTDLELAFVNQGLSLDQARRALKVVEGDEERALRVLGRYRDDNGKDFYDFSSFLEILVSAKARLSLRGSRNEDLYSEDVTDRTVLVPREALMQGAYRDTVEESSHYWEHLDERLSD